MQVLQRLTALGIVGVLGVAGASIYKLEGGAVQTPYLDGAGIPTVCVGSTSAVVLGEKVSEAECIQRFGKDLRIAESHVERCTPNLPDAPKAAFISFAFNVGGGAYCSSTLARKANRGDVSGACAELFRWVYIGKTKSPGLYNRRVKEYAICTGRP